MIDTFTTYHQGYIELEIPNDKEWNMYFDRLMRAKRQICTEYIQKKPED